MKSTSKLHDNPFAKLPKRSMDDRLEQLHMSVIAGGGEDAILWLAVETHHGVVYNQYRNLHENDDKMVMFCFTSSKKTHDVCNTYMTRTYDTWQEAARDFLAWATFGVRKDGAHKG